MPLTRGTPPPDADEAATARISERRGAGRVTLERISAICPYLLADGGWRSARALPGHRCTAVVPAESLSGGKQRTLCLTETHVSCPAFEAATARRRSELTKIGIPAERVEGSRIAHAARSVPVALERPHRVAASSKLAAASRSATGAALAIAAVLALSAVVLARLPAGNAASPPAAAGALLASPRTVAQSVLGATASATAPPTRAPRPSVTPSASDDAAASYRVEAGDTLSAIAQRFGTTVDVLAELNGIDDPGSIQVGQELLLP